MVGLWVDVTSRHHKRGRRKKEAIVGNRNENRNKKEDCRKVGAKITRK